MVVRYVWRELSTLSRARLHRVPLLRLTGLPSRSRCPRAEVERNGDGILVVFSGDAARHLIEVPQAFLGPDPEHEELRLLAALQRLGYEVSRRPPCI